eukprot:2526270-Rhodomonas_salina.2
MLLLVSSRNKSAQQRHTPSAHTSAQQRHTHTIGTPSSHLVRWDELGDGAGQYAMPQTHVLPHSVEPPVQQSLHERIMLTPISDQHRACDHADRISAAPCSSSAPAPGPKTPGDARAG